MSCPSISKITKKVMEAEHYSLFTFGYDKWEAEEYNGLDEFLTKRTYRTDLTTVKNTLSKLSKFIASGYALEITRRMGNTDSKDWRYDQETFIICCQRKVEFNVDFDPTITPNGAFSFDFVGDPAATFNTGIGGTFFITVQGSQSNDGIITCYGYTYVNNRLTFLVVSPALTAEQATGVTFVGAVYPPDSLYVELGHIISPVNIIDPSSIYNFRISPLRNAMRWMDKVFASYRQQPLTNKITFTDGTGNFYASGELDGSCKWENGAITENMTIDYSIFADIDSAAPLLRPERVEFEYPMSVKDFNRIKADLYGKIHYSSDCETGHGWIDNIKYKPEEGLANFTLIPEFT